MNIKRLIDSMNQQSSTLFSSSKFGILLPLVLVFLLVGCKTTKKKDDISGLGMFYQNMTAHYNGHFNATELMKESVLALETEHKDNYNQILPVFEYTAVGDPKSVAGNLDEIIKKASVNISLHRPSRWTDDSYLIIGQSQYMKQDYESAQKTLEYMINNFDETGKSKAKSSKKPSKSKSKAERQKQILAKSKEIEARKKDAAKDRKERNKEITDKKKSQAKVRKATKKEREKEAKVRAKKRKKANTARKKSRNKGSKKRKKKVPYAKSPTKTESDADKKVDDKKESTSTPKIEKSDKLTPKKTAEDTKENTAKKKKESQKEEDDKKKEKEEKIKTGSLAHKPAYHYGVLWLAKTYVERDFITQADRLFRQVAQSGIDDKELQEELYPSMADYYIYTENYAEAIPALEMAIETTKRKALKARYAFIIGQLKTLMGNKSEAVAYFDQAASWSREYEMEFNARLNSKLASMSSGSQGQEAIANELEKMLKDDKNNEYKDQIYFQIAKVYLEANNFPKAEEYLKLALENVSSNPAQKTEIHYALGEIYYGKDKFDLAYDQYSLAIASMAKTDGRYHDMEERTTNLKGIATHLKELNLQDSLLMLASLSDDELKDRAAVILKEKNEKMAAAEEKMRENSGKNASTTIAAVSPIASSNSLGSKFFAYNDKDLKKGEREFAKTWGSRALVDDWRRQESSESEDSAANDVEISVSKDVTNSEVEDIFKSLPKSEEDQVAANQKIGEALYNLGMEYRNKLERLDLSSDAFLRFVNNHEEDVRIPEAYYFLYLNARDQNNTALANQYAAVLQDKFPDTKYALIAANPDYINELLSKKNTVVELYEATYAAFQAQDYKRVYDAFDLAKEAYGSDNVYISKFALLQAMSVGDLQGKDKYIDALRTVVAQYPNTPEQIRAREIIRFLGGDENAFGKEWDDAITISTFKVEYDKLHYVVVVLHNEDVIPIDKTKIKINQYNTLFHKLEKYSIRSFTVNREADQSAILIRKFENKDAAMKYYTEVEGRKSDFLPEGSDVDIFAISQFNYREMIKAGGAESYEQFFEDNYLR